MNFKSLGLVAIVVVIATFYGLSKFKSSVQKQELNIFAMADYIPDDVIHEFESIHNVKVRYDNFSNNEELLAKLQAGATGYDIIIPSDYMVNALIENSLLQKLDREMLPNFKNLSPDFMGLPFDRSNEYSVPYLWGTTGVVYNSKHVKDPEPSWNLLFKAEYRGRISILEDAREAIGISMRKLGYSANSEDPNEIEKARVMLSELKPHVRMFTADPKQHLQSEDVWIAQIYSGDAMVTALTKPEFKYFVPKEGSTIWVDNLAIPNGSKNVETAHAFINFILESKVAARLAQTTLFSTPNMGAENIIENESLKSSHFEKVRNTKLEFLKDLGPKMELWDEAWTKIKSN